MKLPRDLSGRGLAKALQVLGYRVTRQTGSHLRITTTTHGEHHVTVPDHDPLRVGTLGGILALAENPRPVGTNAEAAQDARCAARGDPRPPVATLLREHWLASAYEGADAYVFCDSLRRGLDYRDVGAGFRAAVQRAGVSGRGGSRSTPCATASPRS